MSNGGPQTEQERKAILVAAQIEARRRSSKIGKAAGFLNGVQKKIERETVENVIRSRTAAALHGGQRPTLLSGSLTGRIINNAFDKKFEQAWDQEMAADETEEEELESETEEAENEESLEQDQQEQAEQQAEEEAAIQSQIISEQARQAQFQANQQQERIRLQNLAQIKEQLLAREREKVQKKIRKKVNNYLRRGAEEIAQFIGNAFDLGTSGISIVVTIFVYAFTLTDLNLQIIWGHYLKKGKSFIFPALDDWDPLPISTNLVPIIVLHTLIFLIDILVAICLLVLFTSMLLIALSPSIIIGGSLWYLASEFIF